MNNFNYTSDQETSERISAQRDDIYDGVIDQFLLVFPLELAAQVLSAVQVLVPVIELLQYLLH